MNFVADALFAVATPPFAGCVWSAVYRLLRLRQPPKFVRTWIGSGAVGILVGIINRDMGWLTGSAVSLAVGVAIWWWRRRKDRKRALQALGYKARALLAAVVRRAREAAQPRPVLQPQRQGAGA